VCAPADCPQHEGLCPAPAQVRRLLDYLDRARLQDLHMLASLSGSAMCFEHAQRSWSCTGPQHITSSGTSAGSSCRRMALGRTARLDVLALMLRCGVCCSRSYRRQASVVTRLKEHATVALDGRASCRFAPVMCSLGQPHTRADQARTFQSADCLGPGCQRGAFREACCQAHLLGTPHEALCRVATACNKWPRP